MYIVHTNYKMFPDTTSDIMAKTVKARERHGSPSLDLTLPAEGVRDYDVNPGDVFEFKIRSDDDGLTLTYRRVYESEK